MTDHVAAIAGIPPETRAYLTRRSDRAGLLHLAGHLGLIALTGAGILAQVPGWPLLMLPHGIALVFLFNLLHETTHDTPFRTVWLNRAAGWLPAVVLGLPQAWFRYFHMAHHRYTQDPERDPELAEPHPDTWPGFLWHLTGLPVWWGQIRTLIRNATGRCDDSFVPSSARHRVTREARIILAIYAAVALVSVAAGFWQILVLWPVPLLLGQPFLRVYLLAEHGRCAQVANMLENSRTTLTNRAVRFLAWNMPFHAEHHSYPGVPFHKLPDLHRYLATDIRHVTPGYRAFARDYAEGLSDG